MPQEVGRLEVDEVRHGFQRRLDPIAGEHRRQRRLGRDHGLPSPDTVETGQDPVGVGDEDVTQARVELSPSAFGRQDPDPTDTAYPMGHFDELRELRDPRRDRDGLAP